MNNRFFTFRDALSSFLPKTAVSASLLFSVLKFVNSEYHYFTAKFNDGTIGNFAFSSDTLDQHSKSCPDSLFVSRSNVSDSNITYVFAEKLWNSCELIHYGNLVRDSNFATKDISNLTDALSDCFDECLPVNYGKLAIMLSIQITAFATIIFCLIKCGKRQNINQAAVAALQISAVGEDEREEELKDHEVEVKIPQNEQRLEMTTQQPYQAISPESPTSMRIKF